MTTKSKPQSRVIAGDYQAYTDFIRANRGTSDRELCAAQVKADSQGWTIYRLCATLYGWSIRYASGLQNFDLIAGHLTLREAVKMAREMCKSPQRACIMSTSDLDLRRRLAAKHYA